MNSTSSVSYDDISQRAHQIWEEAGRPDGQDTAHWLQAERELHAQHGKNQGGDGGRARSAEPPFAAKRAPEIAPHSTDYAHPGATTDSLHHHRTH